jgi:sigma-E factor negative regulatory protein RseA
MSDKLDQAPDQLSRLVDGQLQGEEFDRAVNWLEASAEARQSWDCYHLVGEVIRSGAVAAHRHDPAFVLELHRKIASENLSLIAGYAIPSRAGGQKHVKVMAANDGWWRRVAGLATMAVAGLLAWQAYPWLDGRTSTAPQMAQAAKPGAWPTSPPVGVAATSAASAAVPAMLRDSRLDALLAAHRQFGGTSALQMPSGFLRNATFEAGQP